MQSQTSFVYAGRAAWQAGAPFIQGQQRRSRSSLGDAMPSPQATTVDAGGREVRVSNPDRVIFPETGRSGR